MVKVSGSQRQTYPYDCQNYKPKETPKEPVIEAYIDKGIIKIKANSSHIEILGDGNYILHNGPKNLIHFDC